MARKNVSSQEFIRIYMEVCKNGGTKEEVAERTGMKPESVSPRASQLRKLLEPAGVKLPFLSGGSRKKLDLGALAKMVTDYENDLTEENVDFDGNTNVTISDHLGEDILNDNADDDDENFGRRLVGSM